MIKLFASPPNALTGEKLPSPDLFAYVWGDAHGALEITFTPQLTSAEHAKTIPFFAGTCLVKTKHPHYAEGTHAVVGFLNEEEEGEPGHHLHRSLGFAINWVAEHDESAALAHPHEPHYQDVSTFTGQLHFHTHDAEQELYLALFSLGTQAFEPTEQEVAWFDALLGNEPLWPIRLKNTAAPGASAALSPDTALGEPATNRIRGLVKVLQVPRDQQQEGTTAPFLQFDSYTIRNEVAGNLLGKKVYALVETAGAGAARLLKAVLVSGNTDDEIPAGNLGNRQETLVVGVITAAKDGFILTGGTYRIGSANMKRLNNKRIVATVSHRRETDENNGEFEVFQVRRYAILRRTGANSPS